MFRDTLPADRGMLFIFPTDSIHPFWMKNVHSARHGLAVGYRRGRRRPRRRCRAGSILPSYANAYAARAVWSLRRGREQAPDKPGAVLQCSGVPGFPAEAL
jgi:hypothetical protein